MGLRYTTNQLRRFVIVYLREYNDRQAALAAGIKLEDVQELLMTDEVIDLLSHPLNPRGRMIEFDPLDHMDSIVAWVGDGKTLADYCRQPDTPQFTTVYNWMAEDKEFDERFTRAREDGYDVIAQDCLAIADTPVNEIIEKISIEADDKTKKEITKKDAIQHRKLQVETRLKLLAKWNPKKYGEFSRQEHSGPNGGPIETTPTEPLDSKDIAKRLALMLQKGAKANDKSVK